jgi:Mce-associated membrane protein
VTDANTEEAAVVEEESTATDLTSPAEEPVADEAEGAQDAPETRRSGIGSLLGWVRRWLAAIIVVVLFLASAGVAAGLYFFQYRPDRQTAEAASVALEAAKNGSVALLSYSPDTLDKDFAAAKSNLTGDFLDYYTKFTEQIVTPAAKEKQVKTSAQVVQSAVAEIHRDSAVVLLFINQVTTSKENPDGAFAGSAVKVGMKKIDGRWLIDAFDPV